MRCPACRDNTGIVSKEGGRIWACGRCGHVFSELQKRIGEKMNPSKLLSVDEIKAERVRLARETRELLESIDAHPASVNKMLQDLNEEPIASVLSQRGTTHGDFGDNATVALQIRDVMRGMKPHWHNLTAEQRLALEEIALKIGRICSGGGKVKEHWLDIEGYSKLGGNCATE